MDEGRTSMVSRAFVMAGLLILPACATNGDLEALRTHVNNSLMHNQQQVQSRLSTLEETRKKIDVQEKQMTAALSAKQAQESRLDAIELAVNRSLDQQRLLSQDVATVRMAVQGKEDQLLLLLDAQETLYQDGIRALHAIRGELSGKQNQMSQPRPQGAEPSGALAPLPDSLEKNDFSRPKSR